MEDQHLPDTESLAERVRCCLQTEDELPRDFTTLFRDKLFKFDTNLVPEAIAMYSKLGMYHCVVAIKKAILLRLYVTYYGQEISFVLILAWLNQ